ncbi:short-chain dehydrogenase [Mycolicibacterium moriokaense]|jgi:NAD(P)-dependent dehydrogenase (short-subunit alcohol dehydrogenase family)|uniref:Oxidoreductase n=1 Tax=Mycolicibacterium moriokaense TaxID=39691 RepID=A0AAD1M4C1_9MYCO|nr:SDR family oxidoreductase [Mycolicibacterium moriokaense]MCV7037497.1 SDR family oxidoreductase [Mycolicibacterium moriokaense]ORB14750.1 short-chain dehydrogenase [Mycolicibacterium moriokaense]BBW99565.1 oxidoreductase [Mycolicibacterium moriokaense]
MTGHTLAGKRIVVVGASAGIGKAFATRAIGDGARLVVVARRELPADVLSGAAAATSLSADIRNPHDCAHVGRTAAAALGQVDLMLITAAYAPLKLFAEMDVDDWTKVLATNVIGVHQLIQAHLPVLAPSAIVAVLSSDSVRHPHRALGAYSASKAAMERSLVAWRLEHPGLRFSCVEIGATVPTDFVSEFDPELLGIAAGEWISRGLVPATHMTPEGVADTMAGIYASALENPEVGVDHLTLKSPAPPMSV